LSAARFAALLAAGGIGEPFFCHLRLEGNATSAEEQIAVLLALAERPLGPVNGLALRRRPGAGGVAHWLVQARHAGGVTQVHLRLGGIAAALEAVLEGRDGTLCLDPAGAILRHGRETLEDVAAPGAAPGAPPPDVEACHRLLALLRAGMTERTATA
jgi:hypothetical protein